MLTAYKKVLFIDDDPVNNHLNALVVKKAMQPHTLEILSFTNPKSGLQHVLDNHSDNPVPTVLFLDINMPVLNGWDVLEKMKVLDEFVLKHITIYILSSSIDPADILRANNNLLVKDFISKPLKPHIANIFGATIKANKAVLP